MDSVSAEVWKAEVKGLGADVAGVADLEPLRELRTIPGDLLDPFSRAVSFGVHIPIAVFETVDDRPTPLYSSVYQTANRLLDEVAFKTAKRLQSQGYRALPIPASQVLDRSDWQAAVSHKAVARMAGLGWQGKSLLLVTPEYGPRVRLATVLTDAPLEADSPVPNRCGGCTSCRDACPVGAIKGEGTDDHYKTRNEALYFERCVEKLTTEFAPMQDIGHPICGICIKVCPFGMKPGDSSEKRFAS